MVVFRIDAFCHVLQSCDAAARAIASMSVHQLPQIPCMQLLRASRKQQARAFLGQHGGI